jgi:hypothetical protein
MDDALARDWQFLKVEAEGPTVVVRLNRPEVWGLAADKRSASAAGSGAQALVEPFIEGFRKFNSNSGWAGSGTYAGISAALSHYTNHAPSGQLLLCDLQGGVTADGAELTDPVVMSSTERFGPMDYGMKGIRNFFAHHVCNEWCGKKGWTLPKNCERLFAPREGTMTK